MHVNVDESSATLHARREYSSITEVRLRGFFDRRSTWLGRVHFGRVCACSLVWGL